jgi:hypothetical protein
VELGAPKYVKKSDTTRRPSGSYPESPDANEDARPHAQESFGSRPAWRMKLLQQDGACHRIPGVLDSKCAAPLHAARPAERVRALIGSLDSGVPDRAEGHRAYILESLQRPR